VLTKACFTFRNLPEPPQPSNRTPRSWGLGDGAHPVSGCSLSGTPPLRAVSLARPGFGDHALQNDGPAGPIVAFGVRPDELVWCSVTLFIPGCGCGFRQPQSLRLFGRNSGNAVQRHTTLCAGCTDPEKRQWPSTAARCVTGGSGVASRGPKVKWLAWLLSCVIEGLLDHGLSRRPRSLAA
jgi:hypothetical protein